MKWFKHISDASEDLFVQDLESKFGDAGYAFWFKTLELIALHGKDGVLEISWSIYQKKLHKRRTQVELMLNFCSTSSKLNYSFDEEKLIISCKKFMEMADNYTKYGKTLQSNLEVTEKKQPLEVEVEEEVEREEDIHKNSDSEQTLEKIFSDWNALASKHGLSEVRVLTKKRKSCIKARLSEKSFDLEKIYWHIENSDYLRGLKNNWMVTFDWIFCSTSNYVKILEGNYDNKGSTFKKKTTTAEPAFFTPDQLGLD